MKQKRMAAVLVAIGLSVIACSSLLCGNAIESYEDVTGEVHATYSDSSSTTLQSARQVIENDHISWQRSYGSHNALTLVKAETKMANTVLRFCSKAEC